MTCAVRVTLSSRSPFLLVGAFCMTLLLPVTAQHIGPQLPGATPPPRAPVDPGAIGLPSFSVASPPAGLSIQGGASGVRVEAAFRGHRIAIAPDYSRLNGFTLNTGLASTLGPRAAIGLLVSSSATRKEWLVNTGGDSARPTASSSPPASPSSHTT